MLSIKQLTYALAVQKTLHFKKASAQCNISQSAMSTSLSELEHHLGEKIFERNNKKVLVTPIGKKILDHAQNIIDEVQQLESISALQASPLSFPITIGMIPTVAPFLLPKLLPILSERYPEAKLTIIEEQSHRLVELIRQGDIDSGILALPYPTDGLLDLTFWAEDFYWVTLKNQQLKTLKTVSSKHISNHPLILLNDGHCLKDHVLEVCRFTEQANQNKFSAASLTTLIQMVLGNLGTTLVPEMSVEALTAHHQQLSLIKLNEPSPHRELAFVVRPNYTRLSSIEALMALCKVSLSGTKD